MSIQNVVEWKNEIPENGIQVPSNCTVFSCIPSMDLMSICSFAGSDKRTHSNHQESVDTSQRQLSDARSNVFAHRD